MGDSRDRKRSEVRDSERAINGIGAENNSVNGNKSPVREIYDFLVLVISMAGYVPKNATKARTIAMFGSLLVAIYFGFYQANNHKIAVFYFLISEAMYLGFITVMLSGNIIREWFIEKSGGRNNGYLVFEAILGFLFFHNTVSIGYISSANPGRLFSFIDRDLLRIIVAVMFICGYSIKILAAKAVSVEIYYWKDMFLRKKITDFVISGPYKYLKNPMYGIGQVPAYAVAIWHQSAYGLLAALVNQLLIFLFYFLVEKQFIKKFYQNEAQEQVTAREERALLETESLRD